MALFDELRARRIELGFAQNVRGLFPKSKVELLFEGALISPARSRSSLWLAPGTTGR